MVFLPGLYSPVSTAWTTRHHRVPSWSPKWEPDDTSGEEKVC